MESLEGLDELRQAIERQQVICRTTRPGCLTMREKHLG